MRISKKGKSVFVEIGFWLEKDGSIHMGSNDPAVSNFHVAVNSDPKKPNGHPTLYRRLAGYLKQMGAPAPQLESD